LITAAVDNTARIWDVATGTELARLDATGRNAAAAVSPDGKWILTGSNTNSALLWRFSVRQDASGKVGWEVRVQKSLDGHRAPVTNVSFSPDGRWILTGDANGRAKLWDAADMSSLHPACDLVGHTARITASAFIPGGPRVLTASGDGTVAQWTLQSGEERKDLILRHTQGASVHSLAITPDGRTALTSCEDGRIRHWDLEQAQVIRELGVSPDRAKGGKTQAGRAHGVSIRSDGRVAAVVDTEAQAVRLWDLETGRELRASGRGSGQPYLSLRDRGLVWSACFSPDGTQIATVGGDNARLWNVNLEEQPEREVQSFVPHGPVACVQFSADGQRVATSSWDNSARIWNAQTGKGELKLEGHQGAVNSVVFSPDGKRVLTASGDRTARLWDSATGATLRAFAGHQGPVNMAVLSPDGTRVVTASDDATARLWDAESGQQLRELKWHRFGVRCAAFSADGKYLLTGGDDHAAALWQLDTGNVVMVLEGHTAAVTSVAFSPDGKRAITGSEDFTARVWDAGRREQIPAADVARTTGSGAQKGKEILTLKGHTREVTSVSFSSNGIYALTGSRDGTAILWLATGQWGAPPLAAR
jgi:WD40 repeat protein